MRTTTGRVALRAALETRRSLGVDKAAPVCVFDVCERLDIEVRFVEAPTLEGMYVKEVDTIIVSALRPHGRQAFTCAHELGHKVHGHGTRVDAVEQNLMTVAGRLEEQLADTYASSLLMPSWAVHRALSRRSIAASEVTPVQAYLVAGQLGVGYETLVRQMCHSINALSEQRAAQLLRMTPRRIARSIYPGSRGRLLLVDAAWEDVPLDLEVGDTAIVPPGAEVDGRSVKAIEPHPLGVILEAVSPGVSRIFTHRGWAQFARVARKSFAGRSVFRHLEDPDADPAP